MASDEKKKALDAAIAKLEKDFGKGTVMKLGEGSHVAVETVPTGCLSLDLALGLGGVPKGRVIEVYGPESSGKTTVTLHMIAEVQKRGGIAGFIDAEHALDPVYAKKIGVDIDELYISQPDSGDQALEIAETMVRSGAVDIIVIDSVAALRLRLRLKRQSSISCLEKESPKKEMFWIWQLVLILSRRVVRGMHMKERRSDRDVKMQKHI